MNIPYLDLRVEEPLKSRLLEAVSAVFDHGRVLLGPEVGQFEKAVAERCGTAYAIGVDSGSSALLLALRALGIGPGDEVITTSLSWIATANAISMTGASPVFVDIQEDLNMDSKAIEGALTERSKAVVPVHFSGKMADMEAITELADRHGLAVVEDAAQAFGARRNGRPSGSFGVIGSFSMNCMKPLHSYGEAGCLVTDDVELKEKLELLRYAGTKARQDCHVPSMNHRIDTIQAAMLLVNLARYDEIVARRREIAALYDALLPESVRCPEPGGDDEHVYYTYTILADSRDGLMAFLENKGIETKIHHPILMPYHTAYKGQGQGPFPRAERLVNQILSLPNHEKMTDADVETVAAAVKAYYGG